jgi:hypothetical protein
MKLLRVENKNMIKTKQQFETARQKTSYNFDTKSLSKELQKLNQLIFL